MLGGKKSSAQAAEKALGLEPRGHETPRERGMRREWEQRLAPLAETLTPEDPPDGLFYAVEQRLRVRARERDIRRAQRRAANWRGLALAAGAVAAGLAVFFLGGYGGTGPATGPGARYVAVVYSDANPELPGMIVQVDAASGTATVTPIRLEAPAGSAYEMWHLPDGATRPVSLGLLPSDPAALGPVSAGTGDVFAISLEPAGGSPTGQPTEPLFHGTAVRVPD